MWLRVGRATASLLLIEQTVPISSAEAERGFSQMNLAGTDFTSRLVVSNISDILFVRLTGGLHYPIVGPTGRPDASGRPVGPTIG